jgi:hypothetical protein
MVNLFSIDFDISKVKKKELKMIWNWLLNINFYSMLITLIYVLFLTLRATSMKITAFWDISASHRPDDGGSTHI